MAPSPKASAREIPPKAPPAPDSAELERLRLWFSASFDLLVIKDAQGRWLEANPASLGVFSLQDVDYEGKTSLELAAESRGCREALELDGRSDQATWRAGTQLRNEQIFQLESGGEIVLDLVKIPVFNRDGSRKYLLSVGRDITAKKRAEIELQRTHTQLQHQCRQLQEQLDAANATLYALGGNLPDIAIYRYERRGSGEGRYTHVSRGLESIQGVTLNDLVQDGKITELMHPEDVARFRETERKSAATLSIFDFEGRLQVSTGETKWVRWRAAPRRFANGKILWEGFMSDITRRKLAEEALRDFVNALRVIKECGEAMARTESEGELLQEVCDTVLRIGGVRLAWIGLSGESNGQSMRRAAIAGEDYNPSLSLDEPAEGQGADPVATALREKRTVTFDNLEATAVLEPWKMEALKRGYASIIALPLIAGRSCLGVLAIYSAQRATFTGEKAELLEGLAKDIAHGILARRSHAERERLEKELLRISEREKQLIAQELHDGVCQELAGAAIMGSLLHRRLLQDGSPHSDYAQEVHQVLTAALSDARNLSHGLHPIKSTSGGLLEALSQMAQNATRLYHTSCSFDYDEAAIVEDPSAVTHLYRIAQEALTNALKHGKATRVELALRKCPEGITLTIQDNGIGIRPKAKKGGLGLQLMNHRAQSIGAILQILPGKESGTLVRCDFPQRERPTITA